MSSARTFHHVDTQALPLDILVCACVCAFQSWISRAGIFLIRNWVGIYSSPQFLFKWQVPILVGEGESIFLVLQTILIRILSDCNHATKYPELGKMVVQRSVDRILSKYYISMQHNGVPEDEFWCQ